MICIQGLLLKELKISRLQDMWPDTNRQPHDILDNSFLTLTNENMKVSQVEITSKRQLKEESV